MDVNGPFWDEYFKQFHAVAENVTVWEGPRPSLADARYYLCLYGENGLTPDEEFAMLATLAATQPLYKVEVETSYWIETVLFVPA